MQTVGDRFASPFYEFKLVTDFRSLDVDDVTCKGRSARVELTHVDKNSLIWYFEYPIFHLHKIGQI